jgi:hypothetical protein
LEFLLTVNLYRQLLLTVQMRGNFTAVVAAAAVLTVVVGKDFSFDQDIAFRATYADQPQVADWPTTPFSNLLLKDSAAHLNVKSGDCFAIMQEGVLYTTQRQPLTSKLAMANPFAAWASVLTLNDGTDGIIAASPDDKFDLYAVTLTNIVGLTFDSGAGCGRIADEQTILSSAISWGDVLALTASSGYLWVASSGQGLSQVNLADGTVTSIVLPDMTIRSMTFVTQWNKLFVGTNTALYTLKFHSSTPGDYLLHHEWITGVIDTVPLQFSYDAHGDALWLAESGAVHKLDAQGRWWRHGYHQGAPFGNITSITVADGYVYVGSQSGLAKFRTNANPAQVDTLSRTDERCNLLIDSAGSAETTTCANGADPWVWSYYAGQRYLPDNNVFTLVAAPAVDASGTVVLATTATGTLQLQTAPWTLAEKSAVFKQFQYPRHDRRKLTAGCSLTAYGDLSTYYKGVSDNDGLWTAIHAIGEAYNFAATGSQLARKEAWRAFEALEMLQNVTGVFPTYPARTYCYVDDGDAGCATEDGEDRWHPSTTYEGVMWKGDTSSDETTGHYAALPVLYDLVAQTPEEKQRVYTIIDGMTEGLVRNDLYLVDPSTGQHTTWGFWNPALVNDDPEHYSERGLNSLQILSYLATAYSVTRRALYRDTFNKLVVQHGYVLNAMNVKIDNPDDDNHSDNELISLAYHALFYAWRRVSAEAEPDFKVQHCVTSLRCLLVTLDMFVS